MSDHGASDHVTGEERLDGGNASGAVVRVGDTVRKPWTTTTSRVVEFLEALRAAGLDVPAPLGRDEQGRLILEHIPGTMAIDQVPLERDVVRRVGALIRRIHDASAALEVPDDWPVLLPAPAPDLICHNDLATWNLVIDGDRLVFIDWDGAGPSSRLWDLAYAAISFAHLFPDAPAEESASRLVAFLDGYGAGEELRRQLPEVLGDRAQAMYDHLERSHRDGVEPWSSMFTDVHGPWWLDTTRHIREHESLWRSVERHEMNRQGG